MVGVSVIMVVIGVAVGSVALSIVGLLVFALSMVIFEVTRRSQLKAL